MVCAAGMEDPVRVADDATRRPDPEVPERARRRTLTAKYKREVLADYDAAPDGEKGAPGAPGAGLHDFAGHANGAQFPRTLDSAESASLGCRYRNKLQIRNT